MDSILREPAATPTSALQIKVDANMESLARLAFLNGPSQVHIVVQFSFFIYLFILQMFFKSFKLAPFSLFISKKYDKFLRVSQHIFHQAQNLKM